MLYSLTCLFTLVCAFFVYSNLFGGCWEGLHLYKSHIPTKEPPTGGSWVSSKSFEKWFKVWWKVATDMKLQVLLVLIRMRVVGCHQAVLRYTQGDCVVFSTWPSHRGGLCVAEREPQWERDRVYRSVLQKGGALGLEILRPRCTLLQWEGVGGARRTGARWSGFRSDSQFSRFLSPLWMNPEQANAAVIRGKKSDGPEALAQAAFIKVVTFVGLYYDFFFSLLLFCFRSRA